MQFFQFTEEQEMLRKAVREFVEAEIAPKAAEWDEKDYCPVELFPKMGEMGITGIFVPEQYGGAGLGHVERAICLEEISRHSAGLGIALMTHHLCVAGILYYGTEEQKQKYLPELAAGTKIGGLSVTEPGGGSDFMGQKSTGELKDGYWVLNGRKCFITNSHVADIDIWTVITGQDEKGRPVMTAFIIDPDTPGHTPGRKEHKLGLRGSVTGDVNCVEVKVAPGQMLGKEGAGAKIAMTTIQEVGRAGMSAINVGILRGCVEEGVKFANERIVYGKPIAKLQAIQFDIAETRLEYEAARLLTYRAAGMKDAGIPCATEFAMAKLYATEAACRAAKRIMDMMGGYGIINEYPIGRFLRDALASIPAGGTSHIQKLIIAGSTLSGK
ncbi:MAG: acyl-CoA dehydrogenase [Peptococcaceae bacterium]|jgi:alkylation response protein AidB-like acyl-CoA dehydrogenase|nr:acyl-CoA dehydrogenase [Peptococcaceae bacterium]